MAIYNPFRKIKELEFELDDVSSSLRVVRLDRDMKLRQIKSLESERNDLTYTIKGIKVVTNLLLMAFTASIVFNIYFLSTF